VSKLFSYGSEKQWCVHNLGIVHATERTRKEAIARAVNITGDPWQKCKKYMAVVKVTLVPGWKP